MIDKQNITLPFVGGIDTKTDDKQVAPTKLQVLENGTFLTPKKIKKRNGYTNIGASPFGQVDGGFSYNDLFVAASKQNLLPYEKNANAVLNHGKLYSLIGKNIEIVRDGQQSQVPDYLTVTLAAPYSAQIDLYIFTHTSAGVAAGAGIFYSVIDHVTGAAYQSKVPITGTGTTGYMSKCITMGNKGYFFYATSTGIRAGILTDPTAVLAPSVFFADAANVAVPPAGYSNHDEFYDIALNPAGSKIVIAYFAGPSAIRVSYLDATLAVTSTVLLAVTGYEYYNNIGIAVDPAGNIYITFAGENGGLADVKLIILDSTLATVNTQTILAATPGIPHNIGGVSTPAGKVGFAFETGDQVADADTRKYRRVHTFTVDSTFVVVPGNTYLGLGLVTRPFVMGAPVAASSEIFMNVVYDNKIQGTFFTVRMDTDAIQGVIGPAVARMLIGNAGGVTVDDSLASAIVNGSMVTFPLINKTAFIDFGGANSFSYGLSKQTLDFQDHINNYQKSNLDADVLITGSLPLVYDNGNIVEQNFNYYPEFQLSNNAGGSLSAGVYQYFITYEWYDNNGQRHISIPSVPQSIAVALNDKVTLTIDTLRLTSKKGVLIGIYRTLVNATVAHKLPFSPLILNDPTTDTVVVLDTNSDTVISNQEILYTTGNVLSNDPAPSSAFQEAFKTRIFLGGLEDPNQITYSQIHTSGEPINFNGNLTVQVSSKYGPVTALKSMDDKLVIFTKNNIFYMYGDGPDNTGQNNNFSEPQEIVTPVGCAHPKSIVLYPDGLMFKSEKGIWALSRSLQLSYVGADIEAYSGLNVTSAILLADRNHVRLMTDGFLTANPICLVYDYFVQQWSVFTNHSGFAATLYQGKYIFFDSSGNYMQETDGLFTDNGTAIILKLLTAWIKIGDIQGFQRVRRMIFLGSRKSAHNLNVQVGYDYQSTFPDTMTFSPGVAVPDQIRFHLPRQKNEAIRFLIQDSFSGAPGEGYDVSGLSLEIGIKKGLNKVPALRSTG